ILEAKRSSKDANLGREQALNYAKLVQKADGGDLPFVAYSNGHEHYWWDHEYPPNKVMGFPTKDDLNWMIQKRETKQPLSASMINTDIAGRGYQIQAIRAVLEEIEKKRKDMLL